MPRRKYITAISVISLSSLLFITYSHRLQVCWADNGTVSSSADMTDSASTSNNDSTPLGTSSAPDSLTRDSQSADLDHKNNSDKNQNLPSKPSNPILNQQGSKQRVYTGDEQSYPLPDYRYDSNPEAQRKSHNDNSSLPMYGYDFFNSARQIIDSRRNTMQQMLSNGQPNNHEPENHDNPSHSALSLYGRDYSSTLSETQKIDLMDKKSNNTLTLSEKKKYRVFLFPELYRMDGEFKPITAQRQLPAYRGFENQDNAAPYKKPSGNGYDYYSDINNAGRSKDRSAKDSNTEPKRYGASNDSFVPYEITTDPANPYKFNRSSQYGSSNDPMIPNDITSDPTSPYGGAANKFGSGSNNDDSTQNPYDNADNTGLTTRPRQSKRPVTASQYNTTVPNTFPTYNLLPSTRDIDANYQIADPLASILHQIVASAPTDYQLSGGDQLTLRYSSPTMEERISNIMVDASGGIDVPSVGRVILRGLNIAQAEKTLRSRMSPVYRNVDVSLELGPLRTIPVTVSGESFYPGTYQVPAVTTAFNLVYATGGPTANGTMRNIQVLRHGTVVSTLDVYKMLKGAKEGDTVLKSGDVIYVPPYMNRVTVRGEVRNQAVYELKEGETLTDAVRYAIIKPSGVSQRVLVSTLDPGMKRLLKDVDVNNVSVANSIKLYDGATVDVFSLRQDIANKVTIEGAVDQPGEYALTPDMTIADLIENARGIINETYLSRADLYRFNKDTTLTHIPIQLDKALNRDSSANIKLVRWDRIKIYARNEVAFIGRREITVRGAVKKPGIYYRSDNLRVKDVLLQAGGTLPSAYTTKTTLLHQLSDGTFAYDFINLEQAMKEDPGNNLLLRDNDVLAVYRKDEAQFIPQHTISVLGEVVTPSDNYPRGEGMRLSDALKISGGPTPKAGSLIQIAHARRNEDNRPVNILYEPQTGSVANDPLLEDGDIITIPGRGAYQEKPFVVTLTGAVNRPGPVILGKRQVHITEVLRDAGGVKPEAYIEGAQLVRQVSNQESDPQKDMKSLIIRVNDVLNDSEYQRALAQSDLVKIKAITTASKGQQSISIPGISSADNNAAFPMNSENAIFRRDLVSQPRRLNSSELESAGNVTIDLASAFKHPGSDDDIIMKDGDVITIPERPTTVEVIGAVMQSHSITYHSNENISYYIDRAGGLTPDAAKNRIIIIRTGGGLMPSSKVRSILPGDVILVPTGVLAEKITTKSSEFDSIFKSLTNSALVILVAKKVFGF